jgi:protein-S-isoprenylcysteine O-methyltransferase Ste14
VTPNPVALAGFLLLAATIELQVHIVEEPYLLTVHGDAYRDYLANIGRWRARTSASALHVRSPRCSPSWAWPVW